MRHFDLAVGMRLHFLIFAAMVGTPFLPLPYAGKVFDLAQRLGVPALRGVEREVEGPLLAEVDRLWDERDSAPGGHRPPGRRGVRPGPGHLPGHPGGAGRPALPHPGRRPPDRAPARVGDPAGRTDRPLRRRSAPRWRGSDAGPRHR